ncbi:hypothetical protein BJX62DRAFT_211781 [Aspergillus germanicus]
MYSDSSSPSHPYTYNLAILAYCYPGYLFLYYLILILILLERFCFIPFLLFVGFLEDSTRSDSSLFFSWLTTNAEWDWTLDSEWTAL